MKNHLLIFFNLLCLISLSQEKEIKINNKNIDDYIQEEMQKWNTPGLALCIIKDNKIVKMSTYGYSNVADSTKIDENTLFMIGSVTKQFVATSLLMSLEENNHSINNSIVHFLPDYEISTYHRNITIKELLSNQTGYRSEQDDFLLFESNFNNKELIEKVWSLTPQNKTHTFGYHNTGYVVAGELLESITNKKWIDYLWEKILNPLTMERTDIDFNKLLNDSNRALGYSYVNDTLVGVPHHNLKNKGSAGAMYSSISDMQKWLELQLNSGKINNIQIVDSLLLEQTKTPYVTMFKNNKKSIIRDQEYSLGWYVENKFKQNFISHTGGITGFTSLIALVPELNLGYIILCNSRPTHIPYILSNELMHYFLNKPYRDYSKLYKEYSDNLKKEKREVITKEDISFLSDLKGVYNNSLYGNIKIEYKNEDSSIFLQFENHPNMIGLLEDKIDEKYFFKLTSHILKECIVEFEDNKKEFIFYVNSSSNPEENQRFIFKKTH